MDLNKQTPRALCLTGKRQAERRGDGVRGTTRLRRTLAGTTSRSWFESARLVYGSQSAEPTQTQGSFGQQLQGDLRWKYRSGLALSPDRFACAYPGTRPFHGIFFAECTAEFGISTQPRMSGRAGSAERAVLLKLEAAAVCKAMPFARI